MSSYMCAGRDIWQLTAGRPRADASSMASPGDDRDQSMWKILAEVMDTQRAVRRFLPAPIPNEVIERLVLLATRAPSASNRQPWEFIAVTDANVRQLIGGIYAKASRELFEFLAESSDDDSAKRIYHEALYLSSHLADAPAIVVVCTHVSDRHPLTSQLSSVYPAVQNLLLAARAHGLGSVLTTVHKRLEGEVAEVLGLPASVETVCLIPIGYPANPTKAFRTIGSRRPLASVLHWNRF